jgi:uncharacterized protein
MRKSTLLGLLIVVLILVACAPSTGGTAFSDPVMPGLTADTGWVVDPANGMSPEAEAALERLATQIDGKPEGYQLGVAVFNNAASDSVELATKFGNHNQLGSAENDNGIAVVILLDVQGGDGNKPAVGVAIGSGLEGVLNDSKVGRMLDKTFVPARAEGQWERGLVEFVQAVDLVLTGQDGELYSEPPFSWWSFLLPIIIVLLIVLVLYFLQGGSSGGSSSGGGWSSSSSSSSSFGGGSIGGGGGFSGGGAGR